MSLAFRLARPLLIACFSLSMPLSAAQSPRSPQKPPCVVEDIDTPTMPACVIQAHNDALYIPRKYWITRPSTAMGSPAFGFNPLVASTSTALGEL